MFKIFIAIGEDNPRIEEKIDSQIKEFLKKNPNFKEIHRSAPTLAMSPVGSYNGSYMISIAVTSELETIE